MDMSISQGTNISPWLEREKLQKIIPPYGGVIF